MRSQGMWVAMVLGGTLGLGAAPSWAESPAPVALNDEALAEVMGGVISPGSHVRNFFFGAVSTVRSDVSSFEGSTRSALYNAESSALSSLHHCNSSCSSE